MKVTVKQIAAALKITQQAADKRLAGVRYETEAVRGGRRKLYRVADLDEEIRTAILSTLIDSAPALPALQEQEPDALVQPTSQHTPAAALSTRGDSGRRNGTIGTTDVAGPSPRSSLTDRQREILNARAALIAEVKRLGVSVGTDCAMRKVAELAAAGELREHLQVLVATANAKRGESRTLSRSSLYRWLRASSSGELAPRIQGPDYDLAEDVAAVLALFRQPNKPSLAWCAQEIARSLGIDWQPLYHRADRFRKKLPRTIFHVGRHTGAALKALQPFRRRDFLSLNPDDVWVGDGHAFKAKVAHPITGSPFVPEITVIMDVATRYVVGWSVSLSENCLAIADALRHGIARHGVPLIYYSDNGGGQKNKMFDAPITGTLGALGIHHETGRPRNPQGRGVIERSWQTHLIPAAKRFHTYKGNGADGDTLRLVTREIDQALRAVKKGDVTVLPRKLPTWQQFIGEVEAALEEYNTSHQHSSLPRLNGTPHATPAEYRAARLRGIEIHKPAARELAVLFMPSIVRKAARGEVRLFNGIYFHKDLMLVDGEDVQVAYDIHDNSRVWVKKLSGELIAEAVLDGNRDGYMPRPLVERLREQRAARRMGRLQRQMDEVHAELEGAPAIEAEPALEPIDIAPEPEKVLVLRAEAPRRPMFDSDAEKFRWLLGHAAEVNAEDEGWLAWYRSTDEHADLFGDGKEVAAR